ncbi:hypothetical protein RO21_07630 [[Actinobacillus] muris]|uniref:DUF3240 domain-containing protein n=1 Tax=Muribacter muris TaxID=67855 RepID=A0A0J5P423_9PAST|nr:hypothetical protein [Muribacter muris]KMK51208.1 hypothetical protein RO21_07630 [[Actinobacillus] muris] [Muribacter muris]
MNTSYFNIHAEVDIIHNDRESLSEFIKELKKYGYIFEREYQEEKINGTQNIITFRKNIDLDYIELLDNAIRKEIKEIIPNIDDHQIGNIRNIDFYGKIKTQI